MARSERMSESVKLSVLHTTRGRIVSVPDDLYVMSRSKLATLTRHAWSNLQSIDR